MLKLNLDSNLDLDSLNMDLDLDRNIYYILTNMELRMEFRIPNSRAISKEDMRSQRMGKEALDKFGKITLNFTFRLWILIVCAW